MKFHSVCAVVGIAVSLPCQGWFKAPLQLPTGDLQAAGDLDGDGDPDAVRFPFASGATFFEVMRNQAGQLVAAGQYPLAPNAGGNATLADFDGDGRLDLVVSVWSLPVAGRGVDIYPGLPNATFGAAIRVPSIVAVDYVAVGDANGDGVADLGILGGYPGLVASGVCWLLGDRNRQFAIQPALQTPNGTSLTSLACLDVDGDGLDDLAALDGNVLQLLPTRFGVPTFGATLPAPALSIPQLLAADVDGDHDRDLVVADFRGLSYNLIRFENQGGGVFSASTQTIASTDFGKFFVGDWDGDGDFDLVLRGSPYSSLGLGLVESRPTGFLRAWSNYFRRTSDGDGYGVGCCDFDADGHLDFLDNSFITLGDGTSVDPQLQQDTGTFGVIDWEGDGDLDLPLQNGVLRRNDGRGVFTIDGNTMPTPPAGHFFGGGAVLADFDGDGLNEMLVPLYLLQQSFAIFVQMHRFADDGQGHFLDLGPATPLGAPELSGPAFAIDTNRDGVLDVVARNGVWANSGVHSFTLQATSFQGFQPLQHGDVDGDGDEDLIGGAGGSVRSLALLRQSGPHTFQVVVFAPATGGFVPQNVPVLADLDGDGDLDVAVDDEQFGSSLHLYTNQGGVFTPLPALVLPAELGNTTAMAGDVDGDGRIDLGLASSSELLVFRRNSVGLTYDPPQHYRTWGTRGFADLDQDGDLDLFGTTTVFGRRFDGPTAGLRHQYGTPARGTGGRQLVLGCAGPIRAGLTATLRARGAVGGTFSLLAVGGAQSATPSPVLPTLIHYTLPIFAVLGFSMSGAPGQPGAGQLDVPVAIPPGFGGTTLFFQHFAFDAAAPEGISHSNGLQFTIGN